ncbi:hypothetical protein C4D60_Mb06t23900 [Musa balbisiana]|uniref:Uncharacterized protein n=1 Tax=Musa balbisiana TaxID=52838 RepID=A0A4S8IQ84_MUSBA|nr:hypothetical protein C4D60_Mb06t23900 [Musa balbisiana]
MGVLGDEVLSGATGGLVVPPAIISSTVCIPAVGRLPQLALRQLSLISPADPVKGPMLPIFTMAAAKSLLKAPPLEL